MLYLTLSEILVFKHVVRSVVVHSVHPQDLDHGVTEAAHGLSRRPLHEHHHLVLLHHLSKVFLEVRSRTQEPARGGPRRSGDLFREEAGRPRPQTPRRGPHQVVHGLQEVLNKRMEEMSIYKVAREPLLQAGGDVNSQHARLLRWKAGLEC